MVSVNADGDYEWDSSVQLFTDADKDRLSAAERFLERVKETYAHQPEVVDSFVQAMRKMLTERMDTVELMEYLAELFRKNHHLLDDFNAFLPSGYRFHITPLRHLPYYLCDSEEAASQLADSFVDRLTASLRGHPQLLLRILRAIDRFPGFLPRFDTFDALLRFSSDADVPVAGMTMQQAEEVRSAAAEAESVLRICPPPAEDYLLELMHYLPAGLQHGLADVMHGHTHCIAMTRHGHIPA